MADGEGDPEGQDGEDARGDEARISPDRGRLLEADRHDVLGLARAVGGRHHLDGLRRMVGLAPQGDLTLAGSHRELGDDPALPVGRLGLALLLDRIGAFFSLEQIEKPRQQ